MKTATATTAADRHTNQKIAEVICGKRVKIINSERKCGCGCKGTDPWHRRSFTRTIRGLIIHAEPILVGTVGDFDKIVIAQGTAQFPWGTEEVLLTASRLIDDGRHNGALCAVAWKVADIA